MTHVPEEPDEPRSPEEVPEPPDPADPLKRDQDEDEHPGADPVTSPVPPHD